MDVFDRIVVGVDGTDLGLEALHQALALAPDGATVTAVTAMHTGVAVHAGFQVSDVAAKLEEEGEQARRDAAAIIAERPNCTTMLVRGEAKSALRQACMEADARLLALGARSDSRMVGLMAGETATTLLHDATRSVLFARPQWGRRWSPSRIVVGVDGSEHALAALAVADELAERLGADVTVLAATGGKPISTDGAWAGRVTEWDSGRPTDALRDRSTRADLIIVGSRGLHGLRALGSVSERVAHGALCTALVVHG